MTDSKRCPLCGASITFTGLFGVECQTVTCANAARGLPAALEPGTLEWAIAMHAQGKQVGWQYHGGAVIGPIDPNGMTWLETVVWRVL